MPRRSNQSDPEELRHQLIELLVDFKRKLEKDDLRTQVRALIPAHHLLRDLGGSLIDVDITAARNRILHYFLKYPKTVIQGDELMIVSGIGEWARRVRELRVQLGWHIVTGMTVLEMLQENDLDSDFNDHENMAPDDYMLLTIEQDRDAAYRWNLAHEIRKKKLSAKDKILEYLRANIGNPIAGDELRYVSGNKSEWARRVRELRTEYGWPVVTKQTGMPDLPVGTYVLEMDRQSHVHDRKISDPVRRAVLRRDNYTCRMRDCGWNINEYNRADPRILELHHKRPHVEGGENTKENLITLCNLCHDRVHAGNIELN